MNWNLSIRAVLKGDDEEVAKTAAALLRAAADRIEDFRPCGQLFTCGELVGEYCLTNDNETE